MKTTELVNQKFYRKKRKGLAPVIPVIETKVDSYEYKNGHEQSLLFDMTPDMIKDGNRRLKFKDI